MKYRIEKRVPSALSYGYDHLTLEGEASAQDNKDYQDAVRVADGWEKEKIAALERVGKLACFDPAAPDPRHPPRQTAGKGSSWGAKAPGGFGAAPAPTAAPAAPHGQSAPVQQGSVIDLRKYDAVMNAVASGTGLPRERWEPLWVCAATAWTTKDGQKTFWHRGPTIKEYIQEQQSKGRPPFTIIRAWEQMEKWATALRGDGNLTLEYPVWSREGGNRKAILQMTWQQQQTEQQSGGWGDVPNSTTQADEFDFGTAGDEIPF